MKKFLWILTLLPVSVFAQSPATADSAKTPPANNGYVGSTVCRTCHPNIVVNFYRNPHYKSVASGKEAPERTGCEGCHGPAAAHVAAGGGKNTIPHAFSLMRPDQILDDCLTCHSKDLSRANIRKSQHTEADVVCSSCHSIHNPQTPKALLAKVQKDLCYQCHADVRGQFEMPSKHRVNEGAIQCSDCHNPHGVFNATWSSGTRQHMVDQGPGGDQACYKCHEDKRGPFVFEHAATRVDGCQACHVPHGSTNAKLLTRPVVFTMCLECHNGAGTFGRASAGVDTLSSQHNLADPRFRYCTTCHVRIHGSNSDSNFLR